MSPLTFVGWDLASTAFGLWKGDFKNADTWARWFMPVTPAIKVLGQPASKPKLKQVRCGD
jgi:hypothetical protein